MPNVMAALPNIGGAPCSTPQNLADDPTRVPCSNAAKTRNPLKFAGVPQTNETISDASGPKFRTHHDQASSVPFSFNDNPLPVENRQVLTNFLNIHFRSLPSLPNYILCLLQKTRKVYF